MLTMCISSFFFYKGEIEDIEWIIMMLIGIIEIIFEIGMTYETIKLFA